MKNALVEKALTALGYFLGVIMMGSVVWFSWELVCLLFSTVAKWFS